MARQNRTPIDYKPQAASIFRPREVVEAERTQGAQGALATEPPPPPVQERPNDRTDKRTDDQSNMRTNEQTNGNTDEPISGHAIERATVRHSFDIYRDQLMALGEIQMDLFKRTGKKPKLGPLVQDALDQYIAAQLHTEDAAEATRGDGR